MIRKHRTNMGNASSVLDLQGADAKHHCNPDLLLPRQFERGKLRKRDGQHPDVERDADCRVGPSHCIDVDACSLVFLVPLGPHEFDRRALEDGDEHESQTKRYIEGDGSPDDPLYSSSREDPLIEEEERQLQKRNLGEIEDLQYVEPPSKVVDHFRR